MKKTTVVILISMSAFLISSCNWTGKKAKKAQAAKSESEQTTDISMEEKIAFDPQVLPEDPVF